MFLGSGLVTRGPLIFLWSCLWIVMEVNSQQTYPYVSFKGQTLANHSYVDLSLVGNDDGGSDSVVCHTDLGTCCSSSQGAHRGDWWFPDGSMLPFSGDIYQIRGAQRVDLRRDSSVVTSGIYRCDIPTSSVHDDDISSVRKFYYVGLYPPNEGGVSLSGSIILDLDPLTLICISTGGPATTVTWTRDSVTLTEGNETVLDDRVTGRYNHTLAVTTAGEYMCTVANNKPSSASASITVEMASNPTNLRAVQDSPTSISVSWTPPSPLGVTTGYRISYSASNDSGIESIDGGDRASHRLTGLNNGYTYTISILSTATGGLPNTTPVQAEPVGIVPFPAPVLDITPSATTNTTITIIGSVPSGSVVTGFVLHWTRSTSAGCSDRDERTITVAGTFNGYTITELEEGNTYTITVRTSNMAGNSAPSNSLTAMTTEMVPSGPPASVTVGSITYDSITVQWEEVACLDQNGEITKYKALYMRTGVEESQEVVEVDGGLREATLSGLVSSTNYSIQVAAVNGAGTGPYSDPFSVETEQFQAPPPTDVTAVQNGLTSILVSWSPSSGANGYEIHYNSSGGHSGNVSVNASTDNYQLTGLEREETYTISILATSVDLPSITIQIQVSLIPAPGEVLVRVRSITASSISLSWSVASGRVASWEVVWRPTDRGTESTSGSLPGNTYTIHHLNSSTLYTVTVTATNAAGSIKSPPIIISTVPTVADILRVENIDTTCSQPKLITAVVGGVAGGVIFMVITASIVVIVVFVLKSHRQQLSATAKTSDTEQVVFPVSTDIPLEDLKDENNDDTEPVGFRVSTDVPLEDDKDYEEPKLEITTNVAYNMIKESEEGMDVGYEIPDNNIDTVMSKSPNTVEDSIYEN